MSLVWLEQNKWVRVVGNAVKVGGQVHESCRPQENFKCVVLRVLRSNQRASSRGVYDLMFRRTILVAVWRINYIGAVKHLPAHDCRVFKLY